MLHFTSKFLNRVFFVSFKILQLLTFVINLCIVFNYIPPKVSPYISTLPTITPSHRPNVTNFEVLLCSTLRNFTSTLLLRSWYFPVTFPLHFENFSCILQGFPGIFLVIFNRFYNTFSFTFPVASQYVPSTVLVLSG